MNYLTICRRSKRSLILVGIEYIKGNSVNAPLQPRGKTLLHTSP